MNWKINRDPFYKELLEDGINIDEAGFFEDTSTEDVDLNESLKVLCTPLSFMTDRLFESKNPCIILTTGSFCPIHHGHIEMMENSKIYLESLGYDVIGGFISPGHDEYISAKNKEKAIPIHYRIRAINDMIKTKKWISVDPWEGLFCKVAVNFTDVYVRLCRYVHLHLKRNIPIFFVSGGDNARFALTFLKHGNCIIVDRPDSDYEARFDKYEKLLKENDNIHFIEGKNSMSSTKLRTEVFVPEDKKKLIIRVDNDNIDNNRILLKILSKYFLPIEKKELGDQIEQFYNRPRNENMISMDSLLKAKSNLEISRCYDMFGTKMLEFTNRPGSPEFEEQLSKIEPGNYTLFDDDIHSGGTMRFAKALIEKSGTKNITKITSLNISSPEHSEILDCRDFYIGDPNNGLVIKMPDGKKVRAPYIYPYVCPFIRASIGDPIGFSIEIWKMNMDLFQEKQSTLNDYPFLQDLYLRAGFKLEDTMYDVCKWHHDLLMGLNQGRSVST